MWTTTDLLRLTTANEAICAAIVRISPQQVGVWITVVGKFLLPLESLCMRRTRFLLVLLFSCLLTVSCAGVDRPTSPLTPSAAGRSTARAVPSTASTSSRGDIEWASTGIVPVSRARVVGGIPVLYVHEGSKILVVGLDPKTGAQRWAVAATTADVVPGISLDIDSLGDLVVFLAPGDSPTAGRVTLLDPRTGSQVAQSDSRLYTSYPTTCEEDAPSVCVSAIEGQMRFGRGMTDAVPVPGGDLQSVQGLGDHGLVRYVADGTQRIGVRRGTAVVWQRTEAELFGPAYSTNGGWTWRFDAVSGLFVGTVGPHLSKPHAGAGATQPRLPDAGRPRDHWRGGVAAREHGPVL